MRQLLLRVKAQLESGDLDRIVRGRLVQARDFGFQGNDFGLSVSARFVDLAHIEPESKADAEREKARQDRRAPIAEERYCLRCDQRFSDHRIALSNACMNFTEYPPTRS